MDSKVWFSSVAVSGSFALVSTYQHLFAVAASAGAAGVSVAYQTHFWKGFYALTSCQRTFLAILKWQFNRWRKKNPLYGKLPRCKIHYFVNWTCPTTLSPLLVYPLMPQLLVSPSLPPKSGSLRQNTRIHLTEGEFIMNNWRHFSKTFLSNRWIMKKQPLWQVQRLQLPAWDNCKSFQTRPESCGSLSVSPWEHQVQQSEISTLNCWQWFTMSQFNHICLTFSKPKPKLQPRSNVTVWCLGSSQSLLRRFCLCLPEGTSTFQRDRMTTMDSLKNTKAYTWEKWIPSLFSSVAVCGSFALVST